MSDETADRDRHARRSKSDKHRQSDSKSLKRRTNSTAVEEKRLKSNQTTASRKSRSSSSDHYLTKKESVYVSKVDKKKSSHYSSSSANTKNSYNPNLPTDNNSKKSQPSMSLLNQSLKRKKSTSFYETMRECVSFSKYHPLEDKLLKSFNSSSDNETPNKKIDMNDELFQDILREEEMLKVSKKNVSKLSTQSDKKRTKVIKPQILPPVETIAIDIQPPPPPTLPSPKPPSPPPLPAITNVDVDVDVERKSNEMDGVDECSDMDISEPSTPTNNTANDDDDDQLYLQSLAKPVRMLANESAVGGGMHHFQPTFVHHPPQMFVQPPNFMSAPPQQINPYNNNFSYPSNVPMANQPPSMQPFVHGNVPGGMPAMHQSGVHHHHHHHDAIEPRPHVNNLNFPVQYNNYNSHAVPQPHINYSVRPHSNVQPNANEPNFGHNMNPVVTTSQYTSNVNYTNRNVYGNGNTVVLPPPQSHTPNMMNSQNLHNNMMNAQNLHVNTMSGQGLNTNMINSQNINQNMINSQNLHYGMMNAQNHMMNMQNMMNVQNQLHNHSMKNVHNQSYDYEVINTQSVQTFANNVDMGVANNSQNHIDHVNHIEHAQHAENSNSPVQQTPKVTPQENLLDLLPKITQDYIDKTHPDSTAKSIAVHNIYKDYHKNWSGISKIWGGRSLNSFKIECQVGEGTYGKVYRSKDLFRDEIVALKKIRNDFDHEGFPITAIREIKILRQLCHPNIVKLRDVISDKSDVSDFLSSAGAFYLVFEYMEHDLLGVLESCKVTFSDVQIQSLFKQLMEALNYCHKRNFLHRDLKCSNILLNNKGVLKLADFGLARLYESEGRPYTNKVITLWYRPPELLFGQERYGPYVDVWSAGCILGELFTKRPILSGNKEVVQLDRIFKLCGSPTLKNWPDVIHLPLYQMMKPSVIYPRKLRNHFQFLPPDAIDLMDQMLQLDPHKRISSNDVLKSKFLVDIDPSKIDPPKFPNEVHFHELLYKQRSKMKNSHHQKHEPGSGKNDVNDSQNSNSRFKTGPSENQRLYN